jgi:hypothetical protein
MKNELEGLRVVEDNGPIGPYHRPIRRVIDAILNIAHVELACGHTVIVTNPELIAERSFLVLCGECEAQDQQ